MLRRVARKVRHIIGAPVRRVQAYVSNLSRILPTIAVIVATVSRRVVSSFRPRRRIRLGVDIRPFYEPLTGIGWYLYHLLEELAQDTRFEIIAFGEAALSDDSAALHVKLPAGIELEGFDLRGRKMSRWTNFLTRAAYPLLIGSRRCDVMFGANYFLPRALDAVARRRVITVHDLTYKRFPELVQKETLESLHASMLRELTRADAVICVSEATRVDLLHYYDVAPARVFTIHSGLAEPLKPTVEVDGLPGRYILFVSTIEPRKNLPVLLQAFEQVVARGEYNGDLVLVGRIGWKSEKVVDLLARSPFRQRIHHLDYLSREALATVYAKAEMFVFPSIYEGFGFPLLEAMAQGIPTISARSSSLPEVGGDAAIYFEPQDVDELGRAIVELGRSPERRSELVERGLERVRRFRWDECARQTAAIFQRVVERDR
jgi:glycosyltransferase involved in cell wall biosynthesis